MYGPVDGPRPEYPTLPVQDTPEEPAPELTEQQAFEGLNEHWESYDTAGGRDDDGLVSAEGLAEAASDDSGAFTA